MKKQKADRPARGRANRSYPGDDRPPASENRAGWPPGLDLPELTPDVYINRELSWLAFNERVLEEAAEPAG